MQSNQAALASTACVLAAAVTGAANGPQRPATALWYALLRKPGFTPPGPLIGTAWTLLELLLGAAGYRLLQTKPSPARVVALSGWALTLAGLAGFPWLQFRRHRLASSTAAAAAMAASATATVLAAKRIDPPAALMTVPLLAWLGFATLLSEELWRRNPRLSRD